MTTIPLDYPTLRLIWWTLIGVLLIGFAILDGYTLGTLALLPFVARKDDERRAVINTVSATWEGNQVWFILGGGAIFAAWPALYAASFSGFYLAMFLVLATLILRPVGFKLYRSKRAGKAVAAQLGLCPVRRRLRSGPGVRRGHGQCSPARRAALQPRQRPARYLSTTRSWAAPARPVHPLHPAVRADVSGHAGPARGVLDQPEAGKRRAMAIDLRHRLWHLGGRRGDRLLPDRPRLHSLRRARRYHIAAAVPSDGPSNPTHALEAVNKAGAWLDNYAAPSVDVARSRALGLAGPLVAIVSLRMKADPWAFIGASLGVLGTISTVGLSMFPIILPSSIDAHSSLAGVDGVELATDPVHHAVHDAGPPADRAALHRLGLQGAVRPHPGRQPQDQP